MQNSVEIENIEALRYCEGIEDIELRDGIRGLEIGDLVKLTFLPSASARGETLSVRITDIQGCNFHGTLADKPVSTALAKLRAGSPIDFRSAHIHSLSKSESAHEQ